MGNAPSLFAVVRGEQGILHADTELLHRVLDQLTEPGLVTELVKEFSRAGEDLSLPVDGDLKEWSWERDCQLPPPASNRQTHHILRPSSRWTAGRPRGRGRTDCPLSEGLFAVLVKETGSGLISC
jgi:hypothetical protein